MCIFATTLAGAGEPAPGPLAEGPFHYFQAHCERCHGKVDAPTNTAFEKALPEPDLRRFVQDMASGPGGAPLAGRELDALVALHHAMIAKRPFLAWTRAKAGVLNGEAVPGSVVKARIQGRLIGATLSGFEWTVRLPAGVPASHLIVTATRRGRQAHLDLAKSAFSGVDR